jgi:uncharacterized protein (DUF302 family)
MTGSDDGIIRIPSRHNVAKTIERLQTLLKERGILVFAHIDFSGDADRAGLTMRPEQMLIFGNPKAGTPLMVESPAAGLDLPLKALAWEDAEGRVWLSCNDAAWIAQRHGLGPASAPALQAIAAGLAAAAKAATAA